VKKLLALAVTIAAAAILAVPALAATKKVTIGDNYFVSKHGSHKVTINKGGKVKWVWRSANRHKHNAYQTDGPGHFHSPTHKKSGSFSHTFTKKGTYKFVCTYETMTMTVKVK
jgi:plastocyanin